MTNIPDDAIPGRIEEIMQGDCQLDDAQTRAQMPPDRSQRID